MIINSLKKHVVEKTENKRNISEYRELSQNHFQPRYVVKYAKKQRISSHVQLIVLQPRDQYVFYTCLVFCIELLNLKWSTETAIYNSWPQNMVKLVFFFWFRLNNLRDSISKAFNLNESNDITNCALFH